jgi:hypothetical protein
MFSQHRGPEQTEMKVSRGDEAYSLAPVLILSEPDEKRRHQGDGHRQEHACAFNDPGHSAIPSESK